MQQDRDAIEGHAAPRLQMNPPRYFHTLLHFARRRAHYDGIVERGSGGSGGGKQMVLQTNQRYFFDIRYGDGLGNAECRRQKFRRTLVASRHDGEHRWRTPCDGGEKITVGDAIDSHVKNESRHPGESALSVALDGDQRVTVEIGDNGRGGADPERGSGLRGLADRVEALDGTFAIHSPPGKGTIVRAEFRLGPQSTVHGPRT